MPPKAKKSVRGAPTPPMPSLKDCRIAFVRLTEAGLGNLSKQTIESSVSSLEGAIVTKVDQCTHFIVTEDQYRKKAARVKEAIANDAVYVVSLEWLEASFSAAGKVDESKYLLHVRDSDDKANTQASTGSKRSRKQSHDPADKDTSVTSKKVKAEKTESRSGASPSINIPLDEGIPKTGYQVKIGEDGTIYDATLNQTNAGYNNNKFYRIQILTNGQGSVSKHYLWTRWGRVGEKGQSNMIDSTSFDVILKGFKKKFREKNGNSWEDRMNEVSSGKYIFVERSYEDSDDEESDDVGEPVANKSDSDEEVVAVQSKLTEPVQRLMRLIFNQEYFDSALASLDYDANKMPLGKLSKNTLLRGYTALKDLTDIVASGMSANIADRSNQYFSLIPHAFGRRHPPVLNNMQMIKKELELLDSLSDMQLANDIMKDAKRNKGDAAEQVHVLDRQYDGLGMQEMTAIDPNSDEFTEIHDYLVHSSGHTHGIKYKIQDLFRIERSGEDDRFKTSKFANISNSDRRLLWHGSRCTNFGGILSQGLRIAPPEAPVSGYMFGKGVYLADMSTKSANYCASGLSGGVGILLLCEAELGTPPLKLTDSDYNAGEVAAEKGSISTWGVGMSAPQGWKDAGCINENLAGVMMPDVVSKRPGPTNEPNAFLQYNEYIVYDVAQIKLRYLLRCEMR